MAQKVVFILGPTGVGKTALSVRLAKEFNGEIISSDSVQIYKEFDIGSAKVTKEEMQGVVHHGIDILSPSQEFSVFEYIAYARQKIDEISKRGLLPIIVGGTGLYVRALIEGYNFGGANKNQEFRAEIEKEIEEKGCDGVFARLEKLDPLLASKTDKFNKVRLVRAMEIATQGGEKTKQGSNYDSLVFALTTDREIIYQRINARAEKMVEEGLIDEVSTLYQKYGFCQPMRAIGYKEVVEFLENKVDKNQMIEKIKQHTRNYAKRQLTFLRSMPNVKFIDVKTLDEGYESMKLEVKKWIAK